MLTSSIFCRVIYSFKCVVERGGRVVLLTPHQFTPAGDDDDDFEFDDDDKENDAYDSVSPLNPISKPELDMGPVKLLRLGNHVGETLGSPDNVSKSSGSRSIDYFSRSSGSRGSGFPKPLCFFPSILPRLLL